MSKGLESFIRLKALLLISTKEGKLTSVLDLLNDIEKELKALEIIKKDENLVIAVMSNCKGGEEYDLLKEVLLWA